MFRKIILGYQYSSSLGDKLLDYRKELQKKFRWRIASVALIFLALFSIIFSKQFTPISNVDFLPISEIKSTQDIDLSSKIVFAPDTVRENSPILIELRAKNNSNEAQIFDFKFQSSDILEYAEITPQKDLHIAKDFSYFDEIEIAPHSEEIKQIALTVKSKIPALRQNSNSFDCQISTFFGNLTSQKINCPTVKSLDFLQNLTNLINLEASIWILCVLLFVSAISAFRTNLLLKQIKIISRG